MNFAALIRPERIQISIHGVDAEVQSKISAFGEWIYKCRMETGLIVSVKTSNKYSIGENISLQVDVENIEILEVLN